MALVPPTTPRLMEACCKAVPHASCPLPEWLRWGSSSDPLPSSLPVLTSQLRGVAEGEQE